MPKRLFLILIGVFLAASGSAETLRLNSGESLKGRIRAMDEQTLYLDSTLTSQQLKVERTDIRLIEFDSAERSLSRRLGIGLHYRPNGGSEEISLKNWLSPSDAIELLLGYQEGSVNRFSVEARFSRVFLNEGEHDLFYGAGAGMVTQDSSRGTRFRAYSGGEFFPISNPNIGFSLEIGVLREQGIGDTSQSFYNSVAARYYF